MQFPVSVPTFGHLRNFGEAKKFRDVRMSALTPSLLDSPEQGRFTRIVLRPHVTIPAGADLALAQRLHHTAHEKCYVANSVNFPILCEPVIEFSA